jgi:branched-chain amino acid transport system ATP-binding protein
LERKTLQPALMVENINSFYTKSQILCDVSLHIDLGELVGLLGRNGVGKTTTLHSIMGVVSPRSGSIVFKGKGILGLPSYRIAHLGMGLVPEDRRVFPTLTVHENLPMGIKRSRDKKEASTKTWSTEKVYDHLPVLKRREASKARFFPGGEQQMLSIGRTLMGNIDLILLDEPMEGLAPVIVNDLCDTINSIQQTGTSILLVEESMKIILRLCHRVYVMGKGIIGFQGSRDDLKENIHIRKNTWKSEQGWRRIPLAAGRRLTPILRPPARREKSQLWMETSEIPGDAFTSKAG